MLKTTDLRVLLATNFSDACFRTSGAIAQLADRCLVNLTIAHVVRPDSSSTQTRRELDSFIAEADNFDFTRRVLVESNDPVEAIVSLCEAGGYDIVMAPASDRVGFHRFFYPSLRAKLLNRCSAPLWTFGNCLDRIVFKQSVQTVSCLLNFDQLDGRHMKLAAALAAKMGAKLRLVTVIEPVNEGSLIGSLHSDAPLMPAVAIDRIRAEFAGRPCPEVDVAVGHIASELPRMLTRSSTDLLVVGAGQALDGIVTSKLAPWIDRLPCPALCIDGGSRKFDAWTFQYAPNHERVGVPQRAAIAS